MSNKCFIVGAGDFFGFTITPTENDYIIAADGGLKYVEEAGLKADIVMGDFDSLGFVPEGDNVIKHPVMKDDTDMMLAVKYALEKGYKEIIIYGGTGGRLDHFIANISTLAYACNAGARAFMVSKKQTMTVINDSINLGPQESGIVSVFAYAGEARGVKIEGLLYNVDDYVLKPDMPIGTSNEFVGKEAKISVKDGLLLVMWEEIL